MFFSLSIYSTFIYTGVNTKVQKLLFIFFIPIVLTLQLRFNIICTDYNLFVFAV